MAFELDIPCIIEGVETEAQLAAIRGVAVQAQGRFWGEPQGPERIPMLHPVPLPACREGEPLPGNFAQETGAAPWNVKIASGTSTHCGVSAAAAHLKGAHLSMRNRYLYSQEMIHG
jgi:hypothetical protein